MTQSAQEIPIVPRDAATVVVVRASSEGVELFCVERHRKSGFMGGALVFPGGKVDPGDHHGHWGSMTTPLSARVRAFAEEESVARAYAVAALREALEEAAILPVVGDALDAEALRELRKSVQGDVAGPEASGRPPLAQALEERGLTLDTARLEAMSRWITPAFESRRFDTRFYLLEMPAAQVGEHDDHETTRSFWATPREILARWERGEVMLAPPTSWTISLFLDARTVNDAFEIARAQPQEPILPVLVNEGAGPVIAMPGDPLHPDRAVFGPEVPTRFVLEAGRFVPARRS